MKPSGGRGGRQVFKSERKYPSNWKNISKAVNSRDGDKCSCCGKTRATLNQLNQLDGKQRKLVSHHLFSVQTGNNRKTNLTLICSVCHAKQPGHGHLMKRWREKGF